LTRIGLISDTHGYLDEQVFKYFKDCDEIWHAGDFGMISLAEDLINKTGLPLKGVYGNIDGYDVRSVYPEKLIWKCEEVGVCMIHIGGYPDRYAPGVKKMITDNRSGLFISGHSHILKVMYDDKLKCLHINPGAAGRAGWHLMRTIVTFAIDGNKILDCKVIELGKRGQL
jgi:uncharacterized protein